MNTLIAQLLAVGLFTVPMDARAGRRCGGGGGPVCTWPGGVLGWCGGGAHRDAGGGARAGA